MPSAVRALLGLGAGLAADTFFGDPQQLHPVAGLGTFAACLEKVLWADRRTSGVLHVAAVVAPAVLLSSRAERTLSPGRRTLLLAAAGWAAVGGRSLRCAALVLDDALGAGRLDDARALLPTLCGRDPAGLDEAGLRRAAVESVAENTSDAVVGPLLWGALLGVPGVVAYRTVNTLDAMVGHRSSRYRRFGWAAARLDDVANLLPSRLTALLVMAVAPLTGGDARGAWRVWRRDGSKHPSPNSGQCEAAFAGALGVRLGGRNVYGSRVEDRPVLGDGPAPGPGTVNRAARLSAAVSWAALPASVLLGGALRAALSRAVRR